MVWRTCSVFCMLCVVVLVTASMCQLLGALYLCGVLLLFPRVFLNFFVLHSYFMFVVCSLLPNMLLVFSLYGWLACPFFRFTVLCCCHACFVVGPMFQLRLSIVYVCIVCVFLVGFRVYLCCVIVVRCCLLFCCLAICATLSLCLCCCIYHMVKAFICDVCVLRVVLVILALCLLRCVWSLYVLFVVSPMCSAFLCVTCVVVFVLVGPIVYFCLCSLLVGFGVFVCIQLLIGVVFGCTLLSTLTACMCVVFVVILFVVVRCAALIDVACVVVLVCVRAGNLFSLSWCCMLCCIVCGVVLC